MAKPILYSLELSPPVQAVRLTAAAIGVELDVRDLNLLAGEHLQESFLKINPQHTVPTLVDDGESIWDSHAIVTYLVEKYASGDSLYPKDLLIRARIQQRLHFDSGVLFPAMRVANRSLIFEGASVVAPDQLDTISSALDLTEKFLETDDYMVGNQLTVADFCCASTVLALDYHIPLTLKYPKTHAWLQRLSQIPYFNELSIEANKKYRIFLDCKREENKNAQ